MTMSKAQNVITGKHDQVSRFETGRFQYTNLGMLVIHRLVKNRDLKVIITSSGSTTGTGKTTLAIHLCRWIRQTANSLFDRDRAWSPDRDSFVDVWEYLRAYKNAHPGDALLLDEAELVADSRRAMAGENVKLSQAWAKLRVKNVATIITLPTTTMLDGRLEELADVWINVIKRGEAHPYYLRTKDFPPRNVMRFRMKHGAYNEIIRWDDLDDSLTFDIVARKKEDTGVPGIDDGDHIGKEDLNTAVRETRKEIAQSLVKRLNNGGIEYQADLADVIGIDQSTLSKYKRELESEQS